MLQIPIRRISQFDIDKNKEEISILEETLHAVEKNLKNVKKYAIEHLRKLIDKFGKDYPRKTRVKAIEEIDRRAIETKEIKVGFDLPSGFVGTKVSGASQFACTNFDKLLIFDREGTYKVINIPEKQYIEKLAWAGVADKKTSLNVVYKNRQTHQVWAKRFVVEKFILDKTYRYLPENGELEYLSIDSNTVIELQFSMRAGKKVKNRTFALKEIPVTGAQTRGLRLASEKVRKVMEL